MMDVHVMGPRGVWRVCRRVDRGEEDEEGEGEGAMEVTGVRV